MAVVDRALIISICAKLISEVAIIVLLVYLI
jgi:hypothetical protein